MCDPPTRPWSCARSTTELTPSFTQSAGVPLLSYPISVRPAADSVSGRSGVSMGDERPDRRWRSASGATTLNVADLAQLVEQPCSPGDVMPSSFS